MPILTMAQIPVFLLTVTYAALDPEGVRVTRQKLYEVRGVGIDAAAKLADAQANRNLLLADLAVATGADIIGHALTEAYGTADPVTSTFNLWREMIVSFNLDTLAPKKASHTLYAPSLAFVNGTQLNFGDASVSNFIANFITTGGTVYISDGETVKDANGVASSKIKQTSNGKIYGS